MLSKCQICLEDANPSVVTKCGHIYCRGCLNEWMDSSRSIRSCPICKRQLKKEEFHELTSEVCSICQNKPKLPILTTSGSLFCWACHNKTQCDQGLDPSQIIPIYGTEDETEDVADPAVPPRPVLQPVQTVVETRSRGSDQSTHVVQIDESEDIFINIDVFHKVIISSFVCIGQILLCLKMIAMLHLTLWIWDQDDAHKAMEGFSFIGGLLAIIAITAATWMKPQPANQEKMFALGACVVLDILVSLAIGFKTATGDKKLEALQLFPEYTEFSRLLFCYASLFSPIFILIPIYFIHLSPQEDFRKAHLFWSATTQCTLGFLIQISSALWIHIIDGHLPPNWWYHTLGGNLLTMTSLSFLVMSVFCKCKTLSIFSSLVYLITAGVMIFKFCIFAMDVDVDIDNIPVDGSLAAHSIELSGHLICGVAHLSVMFGSWKLF